MSSVTSVCSFCFEGTTVDNPLLRVCSGVPLKKTIDAAFAKARMPSPKLRNPVPRRGRNVLSEVAYRAIFNKEPASVPKRGARKILSTRDSISFPNTRKKMEATLPIRERAKILSHLFPAYHCLHAECLHTIVTASRASSDCLPCLECRTLIAISPFEAAPEYKDKKQENDLILALKERFTRARLEDATRRGLKFQAIYYLFVLVRIFDAPINIPLGLHSPAQQRALVNLIFEVLYRSILIPEKEPYGEGMSLRPPEPVTNARYTSYILGSTLLPTCTKALEKYFGFHLPFSTKRFLWSYGAPFLGISALFAFHYLDRLLSNHATDLTSDFLGDSIENKSNFPYLDVLAPSGMNFLACFLYHELIGWFKDRAEGRIAADLSRAEAETGEELARLTPSTETLVEWYGRSFEKVLS